jgi:endonuclease G
MNRSRSPLGGIDPRTRQLLTLGVIVVLAVASWWVRHRERPPAPHEPPTGEVDPSVHLAMGNPSGATDDPANRDNFLMRKPYFALAYNNAKGTPNWVSWRLRADDLGTAPRGDFYADTALPAGFKRIASRDYSGSGFDRGHLCPHSDRASTPEASKATFAMTNIVPQSPATNQKAWNDFEEYCRQLVKSDRRTLHLVAGPAGRGGTGRNGPADAIGNGAVAVPATCWKIAVVADGPEAVGPDTRVIALVMPNDMTVGHGWGKFRTSVAEVEALTGYTFLDRVPAAVANGLRTKVDAGPER